MRSDTPWTIALAVAFAGAASACSLVISTDDLEPAGENGPTDSGAGDTSVVIDSGKDSAIFDAPSKDSTTTTTTDSGVGVDSSSADTHGDAPPDTITPPDTTPDTIVVVDTGPPCTKTACGSACVDTTSDPANCGSCGRRCNDDERCVSGSCECRTNLTSCGTQCADLQGDDYHCGTCAVLCSGSKTCAAGACVDTPTCPTGRTLCTGTVPNSGCFDLKNDARNCGDCTTRCRFDEVCANGTCKAYAPAISGCTTTDCTGLLGVTSKCCPSSWSVDYCVVGLTCPGWF